MGGGQRPWRKGVGAVMGNSSQAVCQIEYTQAEGERTRQSEQGRRGETNE